MSDPRLEIIARELEERAAELRAIVGVTASMIEPPTLAADVATRGQAGKVFADEGAETASYFHDYGAFYDFLRSNALLGPKISADELAGCQTIILACAREGWGVSWIAYALATAYHETAHTMLPVKERGGTAYYTRLYDIRGQRPALARKYGNTTPGDGAKYAGRGYPQLTWKVNYEKATKKLRERGWDVDLVNNPDRLLNADVAAAVMVFGMREGWFTGADIDDDLPLDGPATVLQFTRSRDIINGTDKQALIAGYAIDFQTGLLRAGYQRRAA